ncbi:MAG: hypothetical protein Q7R95_04545 [bacterium]|nr:hypothetical protein [bacterium]
MAKPGFWDDTFEKLAELGMSTAKKTVKAGVSIVSPTALIDSALGTKSSSQDKSIEQLEKTKGKKSNNTPLDFQNLQKSYQNKDMQETNAVRQRLFQLVKRDEEKGSMDKKQEEQEKKRKEAYEEQEKQRQIQQKRNQNSVTNSPQGKAQRGKITRKKSSQNEQAEFKPSTGKQ